MDKTRLERLALLTTSVGNFLLALLGISFSLFVNSESILLDGFFNVISFMMSLGTLWIAWLLRQPESMGFQFGYVGFVPLTNLIKGLLIVVVSLFAGVSAVQVILTGGQSSNSTWAIIYAIIAATSCFAIALYQGQVNRRVRSSLVRVDINNWLVNGLISVGVGLAFALSLVIEKTPWAGFTPYADPTLSLILVGVALPMPLQTIAINLKQLLLGAPQAPMQTQIKSTLNTVIASLPYEKIWLRSTQVGDFIYIHLYWLLPSQQQTFTINDLDTIRLHLDSVCKHSWPSSEIDIIFTQAPEVATHLNPATFLCWSAA